MITLGETLSPTLPVSRLTSVTTLARGAVSNKTTFCFLLSDEKLLRRFWFSSASARALRQPRRYDFVDSLFAWFRCGQTCPRMGGFCSRSGRGVHDNLLLLYRTVSGNAAGSPVDSAILQQFTESLGATW
jgi:hypothetical protein